MKISKKKLLEKIARELLEDGEPTNVTAGVAKVDAPFKKKITKRPALELDDEDEVDTEEVPARR